MIILMLLLMMMLMMMVMLMLIPMQVPHPDSSRGAGGIAAVKLLIYKNRLVVVLGVQGSVFRRALQPRR